MRIGVIGAGAWGTALAQVAATGGEPVLIWARESEVADAINDRHENEIFLPDVPLSPSIRATDDIAELTGADALLVVTPAQYLRVALDEAPHATPLVLCAKGIEAATGKLMSEVAAEVRPDAPVAVLSGPTFAHEVAAGKPTAVTLACGDAALGAALARRMAGPAFRTYAASDVAGAEIGGAVKNVLAIACGVVEGAGLGLNARAALIARGFAEMTRFGVARGGRVETLSGLSGLGDLVLTCTSTSSRNFALGVGLGRGESARHLTRNRRTVAEGAHTAPVLRWEASRLGIEMPLTEAVCALLEGAPVAEVIRDLMGRPLKPETV